MVSSSLSSRAKPVKLLKKGTETTKSHRFEPFSQRVSKLKIDPIHRVRRPGFEEEDGDEAFSHFRSSLDHWADMNLSENFSEFVRSVSPLCESLHQVLYHEDKIMALLAEYIDKRDHLSIEPLLNLLSQFARDLGVRFEKHFAPSVTLVASVAASHTDVEVIEWSFTCLAWIFKFLSRLLVPDLRPLLNIMAPYLGKERQKPFVARFAAESMSFLIRKAGLVYYKNKAPLNRAVLCLFQDIRNTAELRNVDTYKEGLMVLFAEAIKGVKGGLHSNASDIFSSLLENSTIGDDLQRSISQQVVCGVLTNVVHNTNPDTFSELVTVLARYIEKMPTEESQNQLNISTHLMFVCVTTRKATRVKEWKTVHQALLTLLQRALDIFPSSKAVLPRILATVAYALQLSPMDEMLPFMRPLMDVVADDRLEPFFLPFCSTFAEFGSERFHAVVLPYFQRYLASFWKTKEADLCLSLLQLEGAGCITSQPARPGYITCPNDWKSQISEKFSKHEHSTEDVALLNIYSRLYPAVSLSNEPSVLPRIIESLHGLLLSSLNSSTTELDPLKTFTCGQGFKTYVDLAFQCRMLDASLWQSVISSGARFARSTLFLEATLAFLERSDVAKTTKDELDEFAGALIDNLTSPSQPLRLLSLKILNIFIKLIGENDQMATSIAIEVEESELTLQTSRFLSMQVRKLGLLYPQIASHSWFGKLVTKFCFGLFSKQLAQLWADSAETLKLICEHASGESVVTELSMLWLQHDVDSGNDDIDSDERPPFTSPDFGCFNASSVEKTFGSHFQSDKDSKETLIESFNSSHVFSTLIPRYARARSLQVLNAIPEVAEKRSRQIVPIFLNWALREGDVSTSADQSSKSSATITSDDDAPLWGYKDRLALLGLFEKFINPRTLFKSSEVYDALLNLTAHGDSAVQKLALKAIFTWKLPGIRPYQENLLNLLDETRFREELAAFVRIEENDSIIEKGHKAELLPILLRLLFGRMISKASSSGSGGQGGRRKAILRTLSNMAEPDFELFVQIAFGSLHNLDLLKGDRIESSLFDVEFVNLRRQSGLLKMVETMLDTLQGRMSPYIIKSMDIILYILVRANRALEAEAQDDTSSDGKAPALREIRAVGIRCLGMIFSVAPEIDWTPYVTVIYDEVINARLENFAIENAQGISGFHRLFHTWASFPKSVFYLSRSGSDVLSAVVETLNVPSARDEVKVYILESILQPLINLSTGRAIKESEELSDFAPKEVLETVLAPYTESILAHLSKLLQSEPSRQVLVASVETLSLIAPCVETSSETTSLIKISTYLLRQSQDKISPKTKSGLLHSLQHFIPLSSISSDPTLAEDVFTTVSSLYDFFKDDENRNVLSVVLSEFAKHDKDLEETSLLCADLNAVASTKLDEIDYDRRLKAFRTVNENLWNSMSSKQWRPILFNMLYHVKDDKELSIRSSASFGIKRFIEKASDDTANQPGFAALRDDVLLPALQSGMRQRSEMVRLEFVSALGHLVKLNPTLTSVQDMHVLLVAGDEEASFFNNILHIQQHRRMRALRRLATEASNGKISSANISSFFLPMIEHFVFHVAEDETAHNLAAEAVATIGGLGEWMEWNQFRAVFRRYRGNMTSKPELERNMARLLGRMTDALTTASNQKNETSHTEDVDMDGGVDSSSSTKCRLAMTLPVSSKIATELTTHFLPFLTGFVHHKDEAQMSMRLPVAVTTVKLLKLLPEEELAIRLPSVLLDVCYILRSKSQDSRDTARKTLAEIAIILGPSYFGYILKELKTALARGYQLHVLGFTVHSILVATTDEYEQGALDHCLGDVVSVVMDDIFGAVGQEKDAEDYVSKMKEIKSNKSYDSMELLAKNSSVSSLGALVKPLQMLLREKLTASIVRKVDELFRRIGLGLLRNPGVESREILVFCYEVIKESYEDHSENTKTPMESARNRRFLINMHGTKRGEKRGSTSSYLHKLPRFALDVLRSVLNKFNSLMTTSNLVGFLPVIGDSVIQSHEEVKLSAMRLLSAIIKLPLAELDQNAPTYLAEAVKVVKEAPSTNTEAAQAALKLIAAILRERKTVELRDNHLSYLLKRLTDDIEEPDRQGLTFNFIRAVMDRKFLVPELYDLVDNIARMMVTNQTRSARDLARGVYVHFLLEYPQAKSRWSKQLGFLAKNFDYQHREGRESVMEAVHRLLSKTGGDLGQEIISTFFLPVVLVMANDDIPECRQLAGLLLGEFFGRADKDRLEIMLKPLHSWLEQTENKQLISTGLQAMRVFFESEDVEKKKESRYIVDMIPSIVQPIVGNPESEDWEVLYFALQVFVKVCKSTPSIAFGKDCEHMWSISQEALFFPHAWVKTCAANLVGLLFADVAKANAAVGFASVPLPTKYGLELDKERMIQLTRGSIRSLQTPNVSEELAMQSVRNIVFLSRCFAVNDVELSAKQSEQTKEDVVFSEASDDSEAEEQEEEDDQEDESPNGTTTQSRSPVYYIFRQASDILRREVISTRAGALVSKTACMALIAAMCRHLDAEKLMGTGSLRLILLPLQHLIDPNITHPRSSDPDFQTAYKSLVTNAQEILDLLQKKLGTTEYVTQVASIQENIRARRDERRMKRRIEAVADPEKFGREKKRRNERKKFKRSERDRGFRDRRRGY